MGNTVNYTEELEQQNEELRKKLALKEELYDNASPHLPVWIPKDVGGFTTYILRNRFFVIASVDFEFCYKTKFHVSFGDGTVPAEYHGTIEECKSYVERMVYGTLYCIHPKA